MENTIEKGKKPIIIEKENNYSNKKYQKKHNIVKIIILMFVLIIIPIIGIIINNNLINIEDVKDSVVLIKIYDNLDNEISTGSGFCAYNNNMIITNYHVIEGAYKIRIVTDDGKEHSIDKINIFNKYNDIAIISGDFQLKPLKISKINNLKAGEKITAIGSPKGQLNTVSTGIISNADDDFSIRITAPISPGSSGGVLLNKNNKVIGITYATYNSNDSQNLNYAISIKYLEKLYNALEEEKYETLTTSNILNHNFTVSSINKFYECTNKEFIFKKAIKDDWKKVFENFSDEEKSVVLELYEELDSKREKSIPVSEWNIEDYILDLNILDKREYSIVISDLYFNKDKQKHKIIDKYNLSTYKKMMILILMCDYKLENFKDKDVKNLISNINKLNYSEEILDIIYKKLGFTIKGNMIYW